MAPEEALRYIVTQEVVHLGAPDHSQVVWLTVRSLCPPMVGAQQWLVSHGTQLQGNLRTVLPVSVLGR
jgi:predicted metal-dependent hydrolase